MVNVEHVIRSYHATGLYTHVYVACGFLHEEKPIFESEILPDEMSIFDLASLTKALVTGPLVLNECYRQNINPDTGRLSELFGDCAVNLYGQDIGSLLITSILRHETGLPAWRNFYVECQGKRQSLQSVALAASGLGKNNQEVYSDVGFMILGKLLEAKTKKTLAQLWIDFSDNMGCREKGWIGPSVSIMRDQAVPTGFCPVRGRQLKGEVHDENAWALGGFAGHAGLFGSGRAVVSYLHALWRSSIGRKLIEANFEMAKSPGDSLLGWRKGKDPSARTFADGRGCGHLGFTGTAFWVDPITLGYGVVLTNRVVSGRVTPAIKDMRAETLAAVWAILKTHPNS